jgi:hypothetical protein
MELKESSKNHIVSLLDSILREQFTGEKANAKPYLDRINFACPYCGDSHGGTFKKRGNIYWKNLKFHCYNGGCPKPHTTVVDFLKDHGKSFNQKDELIHVLDFIQANYDIGNSASLGFNPEEELDAYGQRILNVHVKDRKLGGTTVPLGTGNANLDLVFKELNEINYSGGITMQAARGDDDVKIAKEQFGYVQSIIKNIR